MGVFRNALWYCVAQLYQLAGGDIYCVLKSSKSIRIQSMTGLQDPAELSDQNEEQTLEYRMRGRTFWETVSVPEIKQSTIIFPVRLEGISEETKQEYTCYAKQVVFYGKTMSDKKVIWNEGQDIAKAPDEILTDHAEVFTELKEYYKQTSESETTKISFYEDTYSLYNLYRFSHYYEEAYGKYIWLKSGASLVIEHTEAMTVIDVNTGSVLKKKKQEDTLFYQINREAAKEIARQLRLRNISGIIMIDFINMKDTAQKEKLLSLLDSECKKDRVHCNVIDMTALNLVEMTRSKVRKPLHEQIRSCMKNNRS